ncbi:MAG: hypothetical protein GY733_04410 [bacterium]|nr:hypothetical protein [bacterium]
MFTPPRCPRPACPAHADPPEEFFVRTGYYHPKCRSVPVPRFKCKVCRGGFSRQTFRMDYCDNKPHHNAPLFRLLASGLGLRQSARLLALSRRVTELKARKISRHLGRVNRNLTDQFAPGARFMLDEMETFEGERAVLPVTVPVLIEADSMYVLATDVAPIRPSGQMSEERRKAIQRAEARRGRREDWSRNALERTFRRLRVFTKDVGTLDFASDKKQLYSHLLRRFFGAKATHQKISSKLKRDQTNPLKHINLTNAMARDLCGRLRRESWLVSKARRYLRLQLYVFAAYRNFIRRRINRYPETPAQRLGFLPRAARFEDLLTWRQDWRWRSIHTMAQRAESIAEVRGRAAVA